MREETTTTTPYAITTIDLKRFALEYDIERGEYQENAYEGKCFYDWVIEKLGGEKADWPFPKMDEWYKEMDMEQKRPK
jgi:hypothetical protein